jgi:hypothetical protein
VLLVAAAVAGEPISLAANDTQVAGGIGGGLRGMTDPSDVGASGRLHEDDEIGDYLNDVDDLLDSGANVPTDGELGIPSTMLEAYMSAADQLAVAQPACNLDWPLLASIGRIESNHARGGRVDTEGNTTPNILGPVLNGGGFAAIRDTDGGRLDGDGRWDRAVGAMQFIPSTWAGYAADGNDDGVSSPHNVYDATLAAGKYLCSGGMDLAVLEDRKAAVFRYNHSNSYVATVLMWAEAYATGVSPMPDYDVPYGDDYDYGDDSNYAAGPPSNGTTPPVVGPTTNTPVPPPSSTSTTSPTPTTTTSRTPCEQTTSQQPTTTTTTETTTSTTEPTSPETTPTTTSTTTTPPLPDPTHTVVTPPC